MSTLSEMEFHSIVRDEDGQILGIHRPAPIGPKQLLEARFQGMAEAQQVTRQLLDQELPEVLREAYRAGFADGQAAATPAQRRLESASNDMPGCGDALDIEEWVRRDLAARDSKIASEAAR